MDITVTISDAEHKALQNKILSIETWLQNAIHQKARATIDKILPDITDTNPAKLSPAEKATLINAATLTRLADEPEPEP